MSMDTPLGQFLSTKNIKDFETVQGFGSAQYVLGVGDETLGTGIKTTLDNFVASTINAKGSPAITNYSNDITYNEGQWVLDNGTIYKSLVDDNIGHATTDENYWEEVKLSGGYHPNIFDVKWSDHLINDIQWLRADTFSWQSGDVYVTAYNTLVEEYNNTAEEETEDDITFKRSANGFKIATADMESAILSKYNTDGIAWYYILDTTNKQFKLPRTKFGFEGIRTQVGYDIAESLPNIKGTVNVGGPIIAASTNLTGAFYNAIDNVTGEGGGNGSDFLANFDASRSSSTYQDNAPVQERATQMYLYFYVGEYSRDAIEQTAGLNTELFNNKLDLNVSNLSTQGREHISGLGMPSSKYIDLQLGASGSTYIAPANGWLVAAGVSTGGWIKMVCNNISTINYIPSGNGTYAYIPVKKGSITTLSYISANIDHFRFIYAEGSDN